MTSPQHQEEDVPGLGRRNQFDRASQLRRSKKRKKSRENSVLESSNNTSNISNNSNISEAEKKPSKILDKSAKDIAIEETVKTLKTVGPAGTDSG